jgi:hypothetical protein
MMKTVSAAVNIAREHAPNAASLALDLSGRMVIAYFLDRGDSEIRARSLFKRKSGANATTARRSAGGNPI